MKNSPWKLVVVLALVASITSCNDKLPVMKIDLMVEGERGEPIEDALVVFGFDQSGIVGGESSLIRRRTDKDGRVIAKSRTLFGAEIYVEKQNYYRSSISLEPKRAVVPISLSVKLREIRNPVPLYAKQHVGNFPNKKGDFGFDFQYGDWVQPHGKGEVAHILLTAEYEAVSIFEYKGSLKMSFPNDHDGFIEIDEYLSPESPLKMLHEAPARGYLDEITWNTLRNKEKGQKTSTSSTGNINPSGYFLRVNTKVDDDGDIVSANYVKIYGKIGFGPYQNEIGFDYYFNPVINNRNLEFDLEKNLFGADDFRSWYLPRYP